MVIINETSCRWTTRRSNFFCLEPFEFCIQLLRNFRQLNFLIQAFLYCQSKVMPSAMEDFTKIEKIGEGNGCSSNVYSGTFSYFIFFLKAPMVLFIRPKIARLNNLLL